MDAVAARARALAPDMPVVCAFLELQEPTLAQAAAGLVAAGATELAVLPMFLGVGRHARDDLPRLVAELRERHPAVAFRLQTSVGEDSRVVELLAKIAVE